MRGFIISNIKSALLFHSDKDDNLVYNTEKIDDYYISRLTNKKFENDKIFELTKNYFVVLEGVILNKQQLQIRGKTWANTVLELIDNNNLYFDLFRGNYAGAHYDINNKEWTIYTNHFSNKSVFYYYEDNVFIASTDFLSIVEVLRENNIAFSFNEKAAYQLMSYGFMIDDTTYINEIHKLPYGSYIKKTENTIKINRYYDFDYCNTKKNISDKEIIDKLDKLFREAVYLEFEKDKEYGYKHISQLSGGLDSRMVNWVACDLGFDEILNISFSQADYLDEKIAKTVSQKLGTELMIKTLNDGLFLRDIKEITKMTEGMSIYAGVCHVNGMMKYINYNSFGLMHTGDLGDAIIGTYISGKNDEKYYGAYSYKLAHKVDINKYKNINVEKFLMINRGFNGVIHSMISMSNYIENISPFLYKDFFDFCITEIPFDKRKDHYIYKKWILEKYPNVAQIPVERYYNGYIKDSKLLILLRKIKHKGIVECVIWLCNKVGIIRNNNRIYSKNSMNPFDKWYKENGRVKEFMDNYYSSCFRTISNNKILSIDLIKDLDDLYVFGNAIEKTQIITVLSAIMDMYNLNE